jgi:hypothetical protein
MEIIRGVREHAWYEVKGSLGTFSTKMESRAEVQL